MSGQLLSPEMTAAMITNHSGEAQCYGYGIWLKKKDSGYQPYFQGCDPGVSFISSYDAKKRLIIVLVSNYGDNVWELLKRITNDFTG